ncbi:MAG TPA: A/G-specific adenine glycosylase [Cyclobacteriaceae bacterium]|nr:A/G-specific adenine glycosylase [Cyclobacteriaceae bacterium]
MKPVQFSKKLVEWYQDDHRDLPWRNTRDPYKIWLSEIILQQTRVTQGLPYYQKFVKKYPTVVALARARQPDILRLWQGLGYYSRARNLHACARVIVDLHRSKFPTTAAALRMLPGIGSYTAAAIASFAFDEPVAVVDGNVYRVLARYFGISDDITSSAGKVRFAQLAQELIPHNQAAFYNQAIMEFGATCCTPRAPACNACVLRSGCQANAGQNPEDYPVKGKSKAIRQRYFYYFVVRKAGKIAMKPRTDKDIWQGLYDFPLLETKKVLTPASMDKILGRPKGQCTISREYKHQLTHQTLRTRFIEWNDPTTLKQIVGSGMKRVQWLTIRQAEKVPKPVLILRYLEETQIL